MARSFKKGPFADAELKKSRCIKRFRMIKPSLKLGHAVPQFSLPS